MRTAATPEVSALQRLVGAADDFVSDVFGRRPLHVPSTDPHAFADVLDLAAVDEILSGTGLRAPAFRMVRAGRTLPMGPLTRSGRIGSRPVHDLADVAAIQRAFADGATFVLQGLHRSRPAVGRLCRDLELELHHPVQANAYLTPPVAQGLSLHADAHDVFAVQTHGRKRWVVHPPDSDEVWDLELGPGDVLYLPKGVQHAAQTIDAPSLHLTLGVRSRTWRDVVQQAVDRTLAETHHLDKPLPAGWADDPDRLQADLAGHLKAVADSLSHADSAPQALQEQADRFWSARPSHLPGGLTDVLHVDDLTAATVAHRRAGSVCRVRRDGTHVRLFLGDRVLRLPADVEPALRWLADQPQLVPADLAPWLDEPSALVLVRRLVREGLLSIDTPRA